MAIAIPAVVDAQLTALKNTLLPVVDGVTHTSSHPTPPYLNGNRAADLLRALTGLIDVSGLTASGDGTATTLVDTGAYTAGSLVGAKVTFVGDVTAALAGVSAYVIANTTGVLTFAGGALPTAPMTGDTYSIEFTSIDKDLVVLEGGKGKGDSQSNPYGSGPNFVNAVVLLLQLLGASVPSYLGASAAEPFHIGSPHAGAGSQGHGGGYLISAALQAARDAVAAFTAPA